MTRQGMYICVDIKANAFLHHMVRNIVGSLLEVGYGRQQVGWIAELLALKIATRPLRQRNLTDSIWSMSLTQNSINYRSWPLGRCSCWIET